MDLGLAGKAVLVADHCPDTAAAFAAALKREGAAVALCLPEGQAAPEGANALFRCDLAGKAEAEWLRDALHKRLGRLDAVIFRQDAAEPAGLFSLDCGAFHRRLEPARAAFVCCQVFGQYMGSLGRGGALLFVTTLHDEKPNGSDFTHSVAQGMIANLVMEAALEYGQAGVRVNQIAAGAMQGDDRRFPSDLTTFYEGFRFKVPGGSLGRPEDLADLAAFMISEKAAHLNGTRVRADGGLTLHYVDPKANYRAYQAGKEGR